MTGRGPRAATFGARFYSTKLVRNLGATAAVADNTPAVAKIGGKAAWQKQDLLDAKWWGYELDSECLAELDNAVQTSKSANIEWDNGTDAPSRILPKVVVLDPHLDEREITYSEKDGASSRFEACTFYEPAADAAPTRLWIVAGDPRDSRCHSGRPSPLERCRVAKAACFVLPGNQATDEDSNLMGDDFGDKKFVKMKGKTVPVATGAIGLTSETGVKGDKLTGKVGTGCPCARS